MSALRNSLFWGELEVERRERYWSCKSRFTAATSSGVGVACGLWCGMVGLSVSTWESWLKNEDIEGRRFRPLGLSLMLCSTG